MIWKRDRDRDRRLTNFFQRFSEDTHGRWVDAQPKKFSPREIFAL